MQIKFITLNIWHGGKLFNEALQFLKSEKPDILFLQEVYDGKNQTLEKRLRTIEIFNQELQYPHYNFAPKILDVKDVGKIPQGNALFSKFPVTPQTTIFFHSLYGKFSEDEETDWTQWPSLAQHVQIHAGDNTIDAFNVHGPWELSGGDNKQRLKMSRMIVENVKGKNHVILAGDFNVRPDTKTIRNIEKHLTNVFKGELKTTFNMRQKTNPGFATAVVDYLFVSPDIKVEKKFCPQVNISDHFPLIAILNLPDRQESPERELTD